MARKYAALVVVATVLASLFLSAERTTHITGGLANVATGATALAESRGSLGTGASHDNWSIVPAGPAGASAVASQVRVESILAPVHRTAVVLGSNGTNMQPPPPSRHLLAFIHIPKMGGTTVRKLFCEIRLERWECPFKMCTDPAEVSAAATAGRAAWLGGTKHVFLEQHCMRPLSEMVGSLEATRSPLARAGFQLRTLVLLRDPVATTISWFWFFNPTQGPLIGSLDAFARLRPEFVLASLLSGYERRGIGGGDTDAEFGAYRSAIKQANLVKRLNNELLLRFPLKLQQTMRIAARRLAVLRADEARACAAGADLANATTCSAQRSSIADVEAAVLEAERASDARLLAGLPTVSAALANSTARYSRELREIEALSAYVSAVRRRGRGCAAVVAPVSASLARVNHVLLTEHMLDDLSRLFALIGQPAVTASEIRSGRARTQAAQRREVSRGRALLAAAFGAVEAGAAPREWKGRFEARGVFNPSYHPETSPATRTLLVQTSPCSALLHADWTARAPATLRAAVTTLATAPICRLGITGPYC